MNRRERISDGARMALTVLGTGVAFALVCALAWLLVPGGGSR